MDYANMPGMEFIQNPAPELAVEETDVPRVQPIDVEQLHQFTDILKRYKAGKARTERRVVSAENWWKLRNEQEEERMGYAHWHGFRSSSAWLHNIISNKHADAMDSYPTPTILPREQSDEQEAKSLSSIIPCIMEQNYFESTYSTAMWQKLKFGTAVYKVVWDKDLLNGMGDIRISSIPLLNVYWEPGVDDIQKSRYFFDTELVDRDLLERQYPQFKGRGKSNDFFSSKFQYDETADTSDKVTVIGVYYHKDGILHYCKYANDTVLESTENMGMAEGLYDHGKYPFVFDPLYQIEGSPCGYGFIDLERQPQTEIDLLRTAVVQNAMQGATPRYFVRQDGNVNEDEFLDLTKPVIHVEGNLGEDAIRPIQHASLEGNYVSMIQETINELRETSGNTEAATGVSNSSATAASAIAALQEASGKTSRDQIRGTYRCYSKIVELCIELVRQFYDIPRQFRITGEMGEQQFTQFSNEGIAPQPQGVEFGIDMGYRLPLFDIKIDAQKQSRYSQMSQNELALQFYNLGFFNPQMADQALACIDMMEFTGKSKLQQKISQQQQMMQQLQAMTQYAASLAMKYGDQGAMQQIAGMDAALNGQPAPAMGATAKMPTEEAQENWVVKRARERSNNAASPV